LPLGTVGRLRKKLVEKILGGDSDRCIFIGDHLSVTEGEAEDLFPADWYLSAVQEAYGDTSLTPGPEESSITGIAKKMSALFERRNLGRFEKWRPAAVLRDRITAEPGEVPDSVVEQFGAVVEKVNGAFS